MLLPGSSLFAKVSVEGFNNYFTIYIPMLLRKRREYCYLFKGLIIILPFIYPCF